MPDGLFDFALQHLNIAYRWGGKCPLDGLDCSGLIEVLLKPYRVLPDGGPHNAQMLYDFFCNPSHHHSQEPALGSLVFYGADKTHINHVGLCLSQNLMIEAGGGGPTVLQRADAIAHQAYVKLTPIYFGPKMRGIFLPDYADLTSP